MNMIVEQGRSLAAVAELKISDINKETPVGTTLALLERSLKVMSAVQAIHAAMKSEFQLLAGIIAEFKFQKAMNIPLEIPLTKKMQPEKITEM